MKKHPDTQESVYIAVFLMFIFYSFGLRPVHLHMGVFMIYGKGWHANCTHQMCYSYSVSRCISLTSTNISLVSILVSSLFCLVCGAMPRLCARKGKMRMEMTKENTVVKKTGWQRVEKIQINFSSISNL